MYTYDDCLNAVRKFPEFKKVYGCFEDNDSYYFLICIAAGNPFYQVNKKTLSVVVVPGLELQKKKNKLKRVK